MSGDAHDFNNIETRALNKFFILLGKASNEIHAILKETLEEHATPYGSVKNWVAWFNVVIFPTGMRLAWTTQNSDHLGDY